MQPQTIIFLGPQGSGKGTQVELLKTFLKNADPARTIAHLEMGAELRKFAGEGGYTQELTQGILDRGEMVPAFLSSHLMSKFLIGNLKGDEHLFVDGFPREPKQAAIFDTAITFYKRPNPTLLFVNISDNEAVVRLLKRGRHDDTEESIRNRLAWSREQVMPTIENYRANPLYRFVEINGEQTPEQVHADVLKALGL